LISRVVRFLGSVSRSKIWFGKMGVSLLEPRPLAGLLRVQPVDGLHPQEAVVFLRLLGRADLADDEVSPPEPEATDLGLADVDVVGAGEEVGVHPEEADHPQGVVLHDLQRPAAEGVTLLLRLRLEQPHDEVLLLQAAVARDLEGAGQITELIQGLGFQMDVIEIQDGNLNLRLFHVHGPSTQDEDR